MAKRDVIVIGTSAGGLEALKCLMATLPADLPAALFIVWHMASDQPSMLPQVLDRAGPLPVSQAIDGEIIEPGHVYVARPDHHLAVEVCERNEVRGANEAEPFGRARLTHGPKENYFRPSIDVLFRSAALSYGGRVIGVVLTGMLDDGASGLYAIKERDGIAVVQDPLDAMYPNMPISAMKAVQVDYSVPIKEMGGLLMSLVNKPMKANAEQEKREVSGRMEAEVSVALGDNALESGGLKFGEPSMFSCPECHGVLMQLKEGARVRFRCHVGHAYSLEALLTGITKTTEDELWSALRTLEEAEMLMTHMACHLREAGHNDDAQLLAPKMQHAKQRAQLVRQAVLSREVTSEETVESMESGERAASGERPSSQSNTLDVG